MTKHQRYLLPLKANEETRGDSQDHLKRLGCEDLTGGFIGMNKDAITPWFRERWFHFGDMELARSQAAWPVNTPDRVAGAEFT